LVIDQENGKLKLIFSILAFRSRTVASRHSPPTPRKLPRQSRSRATFEAIIQAATYILTESGWDALTTNAIAERAGVNIGSLYQYFPNKQAVIAELQRRHVETIQTELHQAMVPLPSQASMQQAVAHVIDVLIREHQIAPAVHKAIAEELPATARSSQVDNDQFRQRILAELKPLMRNVPDPELSCYMMGVAIHAVIHHVASDRPALLAQARLKAELVAMVVHYLNRPKADPDEPQGD
jgi:AcrR family transcriptional regulator